MRNVDYSGSNDYRVWGHLDMTAFSPDYQKFLARVRRRHPILLESIKIGSRCFDFTRVRDQKVVLDQRIADADRGKPQRMPYWAELWESAIAVGQWLVDRTDGPLSVLDLGCGMGLAGMVAAAMGHRVLLADLEPDALLFAALNVWPWRARARVRRVDWRVDSLDASFDLIVGADVLYERTQWEFLEPFWRDHLAPGGAVLLGEPRRPIAGEFPDWIASKGWRLAVDERFLHEQNKAIRLFLLHLR